QLFDELKKNLSADKKTYLFLDEIQEIEGWERVVNSVTADYNVDIYVTGSNSRMMSSEISTYLTGRYISFHIYTLSFAEYLTFKASYGSVENTRAELLNYIRLGGFPATHIQEFSQEEIYTIVKDIYNSTIFSDIVKHNQIRKIDQLERVIKYTFDNVGNTFSAKSISNYLKSEHRKIDNETVYNYLEKLEKAYLIHRCSRYDLQGKELLKTQEKFYLADTALRYSVLGYNADSVASSLENVVYLELIRRGYTVNIGKVPDGEIDFIATRQNETIYVQVTQGIYSKTTEKREYERLLAIYDNYPKYVLRADEFVGGNYKGIETMHIADFLLSEDY
ncbi:MAG: ATP-binding protein, partial [Clostridiales bacterium]|nr:ATP-binding protein [Clostridiales bacterium]